MPLVSRFDISQKYGIRRIGENTDIGVIIKTIYCNAISAHTENIDTS